MLKGKYYWNKRYSAGLNSGQGSIGELRKFKWDTILSKTTIKNKSVLDYGCGDLSFWKDHIHPEVKKYTGYDISEFIILNHKQKWLDIHPRVSFTHNIVDVPKHDLVFCFDVLFHIIDENLFNYTLKNLISRAKDLLFIYTWRKNPLRYQFKFPPFTKKGFLIKTRIEKITDNEYQKYRDFSDYFYKFTENDFELIGEFFNEKIDPYGCMYVFKKKSNL